MTQVDAPSPSRARSVRALLVILVTGLVVAGAVASYFEYWNGYNSGHNSGLKCGSTQGFYWGQQLGDSEFLLQQDSSLTLAPGSEVEIPDTYFSGGPMQMLLIGSVPRSYVVSVGGDFRVTGTGGNKTDLKAEMFFYGTNVSTGFVPSGQLSGSFSLSEVGGMPTLVIEAAPSNSGNATISFDTPVTVVVNPAPSISQLVGPPVC